MADGLSLCASRARALIAASALGLLSASGACSDDPARPPPAPNTGRAIDNPRACSELQSATLEDAALVLFDAQANCAADGLICPLLSASLKGACDAGFQSIGRCGAHKWHWVCRSLGDAGGGSSMDAGSEAVD